MALKFGYHCLKSVINPRVNIRRYCAINQEPSITNHLVKKKDESDDFGTYDLPVDEKVVYDKFDFVPEDMDSQDKHEAIIADIYRPGRDKFLRRINYLIHEKNNLREALNTLEVEMKEQCVKPEQAHFRILINACSQVGHAKKAFQLHKEYKRRGLKRHVGIYADLFHSCSLCQDKVYALKQATILRKRLAEDHFIPNQILYHTMIQAFGRCGDIETAFELIDEMKTNHVPVVSGTISFLLQGCISDKENGFRHALLTWRALRQKRIWPKIETYNLMLKAAQDCGLGDINFTGDIIKACLPKGNEHVRKLETKEVRNQEEKTPPVQVQMSNMQIVSEEEKNKELGLVPIHDIPNLLSKRPQVDHIVGLAPADTPQNRLMLMGGLAGFIEWMKRDTVAPDIKTFDQLLRVIPNTNESEKELLDLMTKLCIKPDINFLNQLIILRANRKEFDLAKSTLELMYKHDISPDIMTFGSLARCCNDPKSVKIFVTDFKSMGGRMNKEILTTLLNRMAKAHSPFSIEKLLRLCVQQEVKPDRYMIEQVERFYQTYRKFILMKEQGMHVPYPVWQEMRDNNLVNWENFVSYYKEWLTIVKLDLKKDNVEQYKTIKDKIWESKNKL